MKFKSLCTTKEMVFKLKRPPTEWENIFTNYTSAKEPITRIYKKLKILHSPKINKTITKWATELKRTFSKEDVQMTQKTHEKNSPSLTIREV
jgi:plasmid rolling circle replication initiator protein Rep